MPHVPNHVTTSKPINKETKGLSGGDIAGIIIGVAILGSIFAGYMALKCVEKCKNGETHCAVCSGKFLDIFPNSVVSTPTLHTL